MKKFVELNEKELMAVEGGHSTISIGVVSEARYLQGSLSIGKKLKGQLTTGTAGAGISVYGFGNTVMGTVSTNNTTTKSGSSSSADVLAIASKF